MRIVPICYVVDVGGFELIKKYYKIKSHRDATSCVRSFTDPSELSAAELLLLLTVFLIEGKAPLAHIALPSTIAPTVTE